jgi:hypothetical protein
VSLPIYLKSLQAGPGANKIRRARRNGNLDPPLDL